MPAKTEKQRKFMAICAHNPKHAKGKCPPKKEALRLSYGAKASDQADGLEQEK